MKACFERDIIFGMIKLLESVKDAGYSDWQTLTSFLANLLMDQDNPAKMLKRLHDDVKRKLRLMQQQRRAGDAMTDPSRGRAERAARRADPDLRGVGCHDIRTREAVEHGYRLVGLPAGSAPS